MENKRFLFFRIVIFGEINKGCSTGKSEPGSNDMELYYGLSIFPYKKTIKIKKCNKKKFGAIVIN